MAGPDLSGEILDGRYRIIERISQGAMGVVYRAVRTNLDRQVAIKVMHVALPDAMKVRERFEREAQVMARLDHPHCVSIIDYGLHDNKPYVVMELVRGRSLHELLVEQKRLEIPRAVDVMRQILSGLAHAHEQGIIHRDIKPGNIMVTPKAPLGLHVRLLDFGLARIAEGSSSISNGVAVGTPSYMAPEQCRGEPVDATVDIYACGVVLFEMLTGKKPLSSGDPITTIKMQMEQAPPRLAEVTPGDYGALEDIVARALEKAPAARFPSAIAMSEALDAALGGRTAAESTAVLPAAGAEPSVSISIEVGSSVVEKPRSYVRPIAPSSRGWFVVVLVLLALAAAGGAAYVFVIRAEPPPPAPAAPPAPPPHDRVATVPVPVMVATTDPAAENNAKAKALAGEGKKLFAKLWWSDGIASFRAAFKLDPSLRADPEIIAAAVKAFLTTPDYDPRLAGFVTELGSAAAPVLDDAAQAYRDPQLRARAAALAKRLR
ncbi:MAG TPA: serine/threonine-protein kinase [Kofleriaceae bacterium]|nr:serine/threonine-protein kinase [Kofleriaceae bacterium]